MSSPGKARGQDADGEHGEGQPQDPEGKGRRLCGTLLRRGAAADVCTRAAPKARMVVRPSMHDAKLE